MIIELKNISKTYNDGEKELKILQDINLSILENEFIVIKGPSGSGKSTLLNIIGMIIPFSEGKYSINNDIVDNNVNLSKMRNEIFGYIFQDFGLINNISVYKNVKIPLEYSQKFNNCHKQRIEKVLNEVNMLSKINCYPKNLSRGECQKIAIARAIVNKPKIILADEPTASLDKYSRDNIMEILKRLHEEGNTIILVTHDLNLIKYANRIIEIQYGNIYETNHV